MIYFALHSYFVKKINLGCSNISWHCDAKTYLGKKMLFVEIRLFGDHPNDKRVFAYLNVLS